MIPEQVAEYLKSKRIRIRRYSLKQIEEFIREDQLDEETIDKAKILIKGLNNRIDI
jgi:hypothetical protein